MIHILLFYYNLGKKKRIKRKAKKQKKNPKGRKGKPRKRKQRKPLVQEKEEYCQKRDILEQVIGIDQVMIFS